MAASYFKSYEYDLGNVNTGSHKAFFSFGDISCDDLAKDDDGKLLVKLGCSCTATPECVDGGIETGIKVSGNKGTFKRSFRLFLKPKDSSIPLKVKNKKGVVIPNMQLKNMVFVIKANIV